MSRLASERIASRHKHLAHVVTTATPEQHRRAALDAWQLTPGPHNWYLVPDVHPDEVDYIEECLTATADADGFDCIIGLTRHARGHNHPSQYTVHITFRRITYTVEDLATALRTLAKLDLVRVSLPSQGFIIEPGTIND